MTEIAIEITGDRKVGLKFERFPQEAHDALLARITGLTADLKDRVIAAEPERTGRLKSETRSAVEDRPNRITGRVFIGAEFAKAAALEYGAHGTTTVKAHPARLGHVFARLIEPMTVIVAQHDRRVNIAEQRFLRGALAEIAPVAIEQMKEALAEAAAAE